jgi:two-component system CheB/CheR fusion protein
MPSTKRNKPSSTKNPADTLATVAVKDHKTEKERLSGRPQGKSPRPKERSAPPSDKPPNSEQPAIDTGAPDKKQPPSETQAGPAAPANENFCLLRGHGFPIVGVGASAGGLEALEALFSDMPAKSGMAFVVVTHQHPGHLSMLPELLSKITAVPVTEAKDNMRVERDHIYVSSPGGQLDILNGTLHRTGVTEEASPHLPIDHFFRSLAVDQNERAICIILSGTGTDGTLGLKAIKGESGMAMVQQAQSAKYTGMPTSAVATGLADYVLPAQEMPAQLLAYAHGPYLAALPPEDSHELAPEPMQKIFVQLRARTGHDFSGYKASTIRRRIERRMNLHQIKGQAQYLRFLQENPHEIDILFKELLISVTCFFRDPEAFDSLSKSALPDLLKSRPDNYALRVWAPGCATGEEVFSLAILLRECIESAKRAFDVQIFGTDLDNEAVDAARNGLYPDGIAMDVLPPRLDRHFLREDGSYRIRKDIREMAIFAVQNVIKDPPFTKLDLISCRNLLIYLNGDLQKRLLPLFHYALKPGGLLFLGPSETIGGFTDLFDVVDKKWKIFRRKESPLGSHPTIEFPIEPIKSPMEPRGTAPGRPPKEVNIAALVDRVLLARFTPASVVVNDRGDVVYIHGRTGLYLEPAAGQPRWNVLDMAREGLQLELSSAMRQATSQNSEVVREGVRVRTNGDFTFINLTVARISEPETLRGLLLITFRPRPVLPEGQRPKGSRNHKERESTRVEELERELQSTKESLQTTIEELETSNEELKSTNEELQSTNEELQSTNEELETSKEEMQSLNEELTTVNAELHSKVEDLSRANDDMQNLLNSTEIATIFLDSELNIKRYTEQARRLVNLIQGDVGRPLADLASNLNYDKLVHDGREVLRTLVFKQAEVQTKEGQWYLMRIMPYRTSDNVIDGLVLTFVDINPVKEVQKTMRRMSKVFTAALDPMMIVDLSSRILDCNDETIRTYGYLREELLGQPVTMLIPKAQKKSFEELLLRCRDGETIRNLECVRLTKGGMEVKGLMALSLLTDERGDPDAVLLIVKHSGL